MSKYVIEVYALSGVVVRANDFRKDLRLVGYSYYSRIEFNVVVGIKGDSMDRYLVRMNESLESVKTLNKCIRTLTTWYLSYTEVYGHVLTNMESMIHYFFNLKVPRLSNIFIYNAFYPHHNIESVTVDIRNEK